MADPVAQCSIINASARNAMADLLEPLLHAGCEREAVIVALESTVLGVLLALYPDPKDASRMLEEGVVPDVIERLADHGRKFGDLKR